MTQRGATAILPLGLGLLTALFVWGSASGQPAPFSDEVSAEFPELRAEGICAVLVGVGNQSSSDLSRLTSQTDLEEIDDALRQLGEHAGRPVEVAAVAGDEATLPGIRQALAACGGPDAPKGLALFYYVGALVTAPGGAPNPWLLSTAETFESGSEGLPLTDLPETLRPLAGRTGFAVFDVLVDSPSGNAQEAARALASAVRRSGLPVVVLASRKPDYLESPASADSYLARALSEALTSPRADQVPTGDTDGRITLVEISRFLRQRVQDEWLKAPTPDMAALDIGTFRSDYRAVAARPTRLAQIESWQELLSQLSSDGGLDPRLAVEARQVLAGQHTLETVPEDRRADLIGLVGRLVQGDISKEDYGFQRSIVLGSAGQITGGTAGHKPGAGGGWWSGLPFAVRMLLIAGIGGVIVYLISRLYLLRTPQEQQDTLPVMADDFLTIGGDVGKPLGQTKGGKSDSQKPRVGQPAAIRSIRPVRDGSSATGSPSMSRGVTAPSPSRGVPAPASELRPSPASLPPGRTSVEGEEGFDNVERPPSIAELKARFSQKASEAELESFPAASPLGADGGSDAVKEVDLDLDAAISEMPDQVPGGFDIRTVAFASPETPGVDLVDAPTPRPGSLPPVGRPPAPGPSGPAMPRSVPLPRTQPPAASGPAQRSDVAGLAVSPGVLPAIIRAWDLEWTGPMARSRFRILLGSHLEMGRPSRAREGDEADLSISLLPVGEDRRPNAALIAMLSRKAFAVDLVPDGVRVSILNKASAHVSPDPHRPYWDWDNPMPGTERLIGPADTLWVSPHFGKSLAPVAIRALSTAGGGPIACAAEMSFDATFHDLAGISVLLIPEDFDLLWGSETSSQVAPNVGEEPSPWLRASFSVQGLTLLPLQGGKWTRRQGRMLDEQTLLLGGVSSVEWKTDRGEMALKVTPHALPRVGNLTPRPPGPKGP